MEIAGFNTKNNPTENSYVCNRILNSYKQKRSACTAAKVEMVSMKEQEFRNPFLFNIWRKKVNLAE